MSARDFNRALDCTGLHLICTASGARRRVQDEAEASWRAQKATREAQWAKQVADVVAKSVERSQKEAEKAAEEMQKANLRVKSRRYLASVVAKERKSPQGGAGCCSKKMADVVIDPDEIRMEEKTKSLPKLPLPPLVDEVAWSPLLLPSGSTHQVELLLAYVSLDLVMPS